MFKRYFPLLLSLLAGTAAAYSATMWVFPDGRGAMPIETDQITMEAESVSIVLTGNIFSYTDVPEMEVTCVFYLKNLTDQPLEDTIGMQAIRFPGSLTLNEDDNLTLEILEIYPGALYQDAAVSELSLTVAK